jgi:hypothetical protein
VPLPPKKNRPFLIVPWNISECRALVCMQKSEPVQVDLLLGSAILAGLFVVIINGIVWNVL